jgi:hypothetical protein
MKPHRIKMAHNLVVNYDLDQHMQILVRTLSLHDGTS